MTITLQLAKIILPLLVVVALLGTFKLSKDNGFLEMVQGPITSARPTLPDSLIPMRTHWTGIAAVDKQASTFVSFFWACMDGKTPSLSLQAAHFMGQGTALWVLVLVESFRVGNAWHFVSFATIIGLMIENVLMALIVPIYCIIHLLSSPTALPSTSQTKAHRKATILVHPSELSVLPYSVLLGAGIPSLFVFLSTPGSTLQQTALVLRQIHPILSAVAHLVLSVFTKADRDLGSPDRRSLTVLKGLQTVYAFATWTAAIPHIAVCTIMFLSHRIPALFGARYPALFTPTAVFSPPKFWQGPPAPITHVGSGAHAFFQWDEIVSVAAVLVWAMALNRQALAGQKGAPGFWKMMGTVLVMTGVGGPVAAAVALVAQRDQFVLTMLEGEERVSARF